MKMSRELCRPAVLCGVLTAAGRAGAQDVDFGMFVEQQLKAKAMQQFGIVQELVESSYGPYTAADSVAAVEVAKGLSVSLVTAGTHTDNDMMVLWPNDANPTHLIVAIENGTTAPAVQVVRLSDGVVNTIVTGMSVTDPIRITPWGTIIVAEEAGTLGGFYEILNPLGLIGSPVSVTNRDAGTTSDSTRIVKRKAVGTLSWEGISILPNGTMYYADELRPGAGNPGGGIYKFVPATAWFPGSPAITNLANSPFAAGKIYGMRLGTNSGNTDYGQGTEIGKGVWVEINPGTYSDSNQNVILRTAQTALKLTGYYRPEDLELDPIAFAKGIIRVCVANTGRTTHTASSAEEDAATYGEIICVIDEPRPNGTWRPFATRFIQGDPEASHFDNLAFQPHTGALLIQEDGATQMAFGIIVIPRGNDIWMALPDGADRDSMSDGMIRILSLKDTASETTGILFDATGTTAYIGLQHRATNIGAILKITGFKVK